MDEPQDRPIRNERGQLVKGGPNLNPGGSRRIPTEIVDMLKAGSPRAAQVLVEAMEANKTVLVGSGENAFTESIPDHPTRIKAATIIHERLYGKAVQELVGAEGEPLIPRLQLASLSPEQLAALDAVRALAHGKGK